MSVAAWWLMPNFVDLIYNCDASCFYPLSRLIRGARRRKRRKRRRRRRRRRRRSRTINFKPFCWWWQVQQQSGLPDESVYCI
jgi:hypothetical protein